MQESLFYASQELKRAEHLLYVSLKYTRTGDVIMSLVSRLISCFDYILDGLLQKKELEGEITEAPTSPFAKVTLLKKIYATNQEFMDYLDYYLLLRKISRAKIEVTREFRRNLMVEAEVDDKLIQITIDISGDYFHQTVEFLRFIKSIFHKTED